MRQQLTLFSLLLTFSISIFAQKAADFKIITTEDEAISLYGTFLDQGKSVVVELFFVDCPPCRSFAPFMADLHTQMVDKDVQVEFISLSIVDWDTNETVNGFKSEFKHDWPFANFEGGSEAAAEPYIDGTYGQYFGTPAIAVIAPDGTVNYVKRVFNNQGYIEAIEAAIIESQTAFNEGSQPATAIVSGGINTLAGAGLSGVKVNFSGAKDTTIITDDNGGFQTGSLLADESYTIALEKNDNHDNGVTTLDIIFISKHILGLDTFTTAQQFIAADVNQSGTVTTFDLVRIRQLILGLITEFPKNTSWVFEPAEIALASLNDLAALSFTGIKIGDLNNSAKPNEFVLAEDRGTSDALTLLMEDRQFEAGENISIALNSTDLAKIQGFQFTLAFSPEALELREVPTGTLSNYTASNFNLLQKEKGLISTSWDASREQHGFTLFTLNFKAQQSGRLSDLIQLNSDLTSVAAYDWHSETLDVKLAFTNTEKPASTDITIFPNPSISNTVSLGITTDKAKVVNVRILDITGKTLMRTNYALKEGAQLIPINTIDFPTGVYSVQVNEGTSILKTMRLVKQK